MLWHLQLLALLGVASATGNPVYGSGSLQAATNSLLWPAVASNPDVAKHIIDVENALGMCNLTTPTKQSIPEPLQQGPALQVPETLPAPWHAIAQPPNAFCVVAVTQTLLYENTYKPIPGWMPKNATAAQVATVIHGAVNLAIWNAGSSAIEAPYNLTVKSPFYTSLLQTANAEAKGNITNRTASLLVKDQTNMANVTLTLAASSQNMLPVNVSINGQPCSVHVNLTLSNMVPGVPSQGTKSLAESAQSDSAQVEQAATVPVSVSNGQFFGTDKVPITFKGINWSGFETSSTMVGGLNYGTTALTEEFGTVLYRIQLLGFNTIRLPFSFQVLLNSSPLSYTESCTPVTATAVGQSVIPPGTTIPPDATPPAQLAPTGGTSGTCNTALPNTSVYTRFLYVIKVMVDNGFYVLIDNHLALDSTAIDNPSGWVTYWQDLVTAIKGMGPAYQNAVMVDILNEPDARGLTWPQMSNYYLSAMDAIYKVSPSTLFFAEGGGQLGFAQNWGDGFVTDDTVIANFGLSDPKPFFNTVLTRPYANQVVISPHYYPPSISEQKSNFTGLGLFYKMQTSFGSLTSGQGYNGHIFPLVFGETGSSYTAANDIAMLADMARYMHNDYSSLPAGYTAADFPHADMPNLYWWYWNGGESDTGGIVGNDWTTVLWYKVNWLIGAINLIPWYLTYSTSTPPPPPPLVAPPPPPPPSSGGCTNNPPDKTYTCTQQVGWWPGCTVAWLQPPYCDLSCGRCSLQTPPPPPSPSPPPPSPPPPPPPLATPSGGTCTNTPPDSKYTCAEQVGWWPGCTVAWLQSPYCNQSCGRCSLSCTNTPPPGNSYTCAQQVGWWPGCTVSWLQPPYCNQSCGRCS